jgi:hypothetical protein
MSEIQLLSYKQKAKETGKQPITIIRWMKENKITWCKIPISKRKWFFPKITELIIENGLKELKKHE